ncbi:MAG: DedA family protein [Betaproteobacteria bacterium]|nr:DedA family protein [Betaproteobacteria bacterium]
MDEMTSLLAQYGLVLVFANVFLTQVGVPVPAIPTLVVAGTLAQRGDLSAAMVLIVAVGASLLGDLPWFVAGRIYGSRAINVLCRVAIEPDTCVKQTETIFERWGAPSLVFAKFIPGFSIVAPPIAGAMRLAVPPFFVFSAIGAAVWAGVGGHGLRS